jgi:hypothetical protein
MWWLKMEAARSSETMVSNRHTTGRNNAENHEFIPHSSENLKSRPAQLGDCMLKYKILYSQGNVIYAPHVTYRILSYSFLFLWCGC